MTKERKLAIKMWEDIKQRILDGRITDDVIITFYKHQIAIGYGAHWKYDCWFCQYVRRDFARFGDFWEGTGKAKGLGDSGCNFCPLAKAHPDYNPSDIFRDCGCSLPRAPWDVISCKNYDKNEKAAACDIIIKALKGEPIVIKAPEEEI